MREREMRKREREREREKEMRKKRNFVPWKPRASTYLNLSN